jgi:hypothetical protein
VFTTATLDLVRVVSAALSSTLDTVPVHLVLLHDKLKLVMMGEVERKLEMVHVSSEREGGRVRLKDASEDAGCSGGPRPPNRTNQFKISGSAAAYKLLKLVPRCVKADSSRFNG